MSSYETDIALISSTRLWKDYTKRAMAYKESMIRDLMVCQLDKVDKMRGIIEGIDYVLMLPDLMVKQLGNKQIDEGENDNG
jgi:hypothetical protein